MLKIAKMSKLIEKLNKAIHWNVHEKVIRVENGQEWNLSRNMFVIIISMLSVGAVFF